MQGGRAVGSFRFPGAAGSVFGAHVHNNTVDAFDAVCAAFRALRLRRFVRLRARQMIHLFQFVRVRGTGRMFVRIFERRHFLNCFANRRARENDQIQHLTRNL